MNLKETIKCPMGVLHLRALGRDGRELWVDTGRNLIVGQGYELTAQMLAGVPDARISKVAVGTNGAEPLDLDTHITDAVIVDVQSVDYPKPNTVRFHFTIEYDDAPGMQIREFGLLSNDGRLFSRKVRAMIEKTQYMSIVGQWDINL